MAPCDAPRLSLQAFGPFTVFVEGRLLPRRAFGRVAAVRVLQLLLLRQGRPISRDALAETLWPGRELASAVRSLHVALHSLRRAIEPARDGPGWTYVQCEGDRYFLDASDACEVDLYRFRALLAEARSTLASGGTAHDEIAVLERAVALVGGELFADCPDEPLFEPDREEVRLAYRRALLRLADLLERHRRVGPRSVALLRRAVVLDPSSEDVQVHLMRTLVTMGRRVEARRAYERCVEVLAAEFGAAPGGELRRLGLKLGCP